MRNVSNSPDGSEYTAFTPVTLATGGPCLHHSTRLFSCLSSPSAAISTAPSGVFLTQPVSPIFSATSWVCALKKTPWTRPFTMICTLFAVIYPIVSVSDLWAHFALFSNQTPASEIMFLNDASMVSADIHSIELWKFCMPTKRLVESSPLKQRWHESFPPRT